MKKIDNLTPKIIIQQKGKISALEIAKYLLSLDPKREYFTDEKMIKIEGNSVPISGNLRLNKLLQITQMLYAAKHGQYLFSEKMLAFEHGGIVYEVYRQFHFLVNPKNQVAIKSLTIYSKDFLTKIFNYFRTYSNQQLENFVHEDPAWFTIWNKENIKGNNEMPQSKEMIEYYQNFALHVAEAVERKN
ncbi:type II toxin-antitoxin system antitoxin SocA domain-containing protein [endosymbiont GvMRE of Glomus versiforme]|uniref:type II toxin-antitoxin system antitoxin SocA domain-containing protein n=1 Tax=endosymbiont GvMRE of Glomus versiforme TaxID=2039283 RepID=UPI000ED4E247|nr:type II toxin-antitoxin system antitoxin SocA domain-containing protein [endosymbiont GvMRE of Glomus versiforme]RHZ36707.1 hypothetical protein GvMRE_I2g65 [endosymbiont GvMRE of Glomus versiforme]